MPTVTKTRAALQTFLPAVRVDKNFKTILPINTPERSVHQQTSPLYPITRYSGESSTIQYETGNDGSFRPCTHNLTRYVAVPVQQSAFMDGRQRPANFYPDRYCLANGFQNQLHQRYYNNYLAGIASLNTSVASVQWSSLAQTALASMLPTLGGQNSWVNFLLEMKDFKRIALLLSKQVTDKFELFAALLGFSKKSKPLKRLSEIYLQYSFGWAPLYRDILSLYTAIRDMNDRFRIIRDMANTDLQSHFSTSLSGTETSQSLYFSASNILLDSGMGINGDVRVELGASPAIKYNASLRYRYSLPPEIDSFGGQLAIALDTIGVSANPAIIWNAIPFSFLVDWVVDVGGWLNRMRMDNVRFKTEIRDFCHSVKVSRNAAYLVRVNSGFINANNVTTYFRYDYPVTDSAVRTVYQRRKGIPAFQDAMQVSGLNEDEFLLGGALLHANGGRRRRSH